jgi:hypothetical protein
MIKVPTNIANKAGSTDTATFLIDCLKTADAKNIFIPAGGHKNPISILARKIMPKCTGSIP